EGIRILRVNADKTVSARRGTAEFAVLQYLHTLSAQPILPLAFFVRRKTQPPRFLAVVETIQDVGLAGRGDEFSNQRRIPKRILHVGLPLRREFVHLPARSFNQRLLLGGWD